MRQFVVAFLLALAVSSVYGEEKSKEPEFMTAESATWVERQKLYNDLFSSYEKNIYPDNSKVDLGITVMDFQLDAENNQMHTDAWIQYSWTDSRLTWDKASLGISVMRVPQSLVWLPDVTLYNSAKQDERLKCWDSNVLIFSNGNVLWVPPCHLDTYCNITLNRDPYKEQLCTIKFGSWTYDGLTVGLDFYKGKQTADVTAYQGSTEKFQITTNSAVRNEKKYDCCKEPYLDLTYTIGLTRRDESAKNCEL